jgi:hypothetical protein
MEVPIICFDIGAPADRVRGYSNGCVLPMESDSAKLLNLIHAFHKRFQRLSSSSDNLI